VTAASETDTTLARGLAEFPDDVWAEFVATRRSREGNPGASYRATQRQRARERGGRKDAQ
jgi:hypothetical protein